MPDAGIWNEPGAIPPSMMLFAERTTMNPRDDLAAILEHWDGRQAADFVWHYGQDLLDLIDAAEDLKLWDVGGFGWTPALARLDRAVDKLAMTRKDTPR